MTATPKVFGIGLPRCGGQSLQLALCQLGYKHVVHSPGNRVDVIKRCDAAVEVFLPLHWLEETYPGSLYVVNRRPLGAWLESMRSVYMLSGEWNHPIWQYPPSAMRHYALDYYVSLHHTARRLLIKDRVLWIDITAGDGWERLCTLLSKPVPDTAFPRRDAIKNSARAVLKG